jgi:hypothetical protein
VDTIATWPLATRRVCLWLCALVVCPSLSFAAGVLAGSDGEAPKFVFFYGGLPALLAYGSGWLLSVSTTERLAAATAAALVTGALFLALILALASAGAFV